MDLTQMISGVTLTKAITVSPDEDAKKVGTKKTIVLKVKYDGLTLESIFLKALDKDVISWQNGSGGRKNFDNLVDKGIVNVDAMAPGRMPQVDPETAMVAKLAAMTPEEAKAEVARLITLSQNR